MKETGVSVPAAADKESEYPAFVDPKQEDVDGVVVSFAEAPTKFGDCVVVNIDVDGEVRALWLTSTVLRRQFARYLLANANS